MGTLHFIGGEKGGVGKSFTARLLAQYMVDTQRAFVGFDTDKSHGTFTRFYAQFTTEVSIDDYESLDQIVEFAEQNPDCNIIVDLAAQTANGLNRWARECDLYELMDELGYQVFYWHVMDDSADSVFLLDKQMATLEHPKLTLVVVENHGRGNSFKQFENTEVYQKVKSCRAKIIMLARLHESLTQKIDFNNYSFWAAANSRQCMKLTESQRVKVWLRHAYGQIAPLFEDGAKKESKPQPEMQNQQRAYVGQTRDPAIS